MRGKIFVFVLIMCCFAGVLVEYSWGKEYPTKPIELVCPFTPGGTHDLMSRLIADIAPKYLGQPMVVVNRPGAGTSLAAADVISSKPDGYKLVVLANFFFATTVKTQKIPFDPNHLVPIANMWEVKQGLCVKGDSPWKTFGDVLDFAKKNPGKLRWGHNGRALTLHMAPLIIFKKAKVETLDVPYKGGSENLSALLGGHLDVSSNTYGIMQDHVKAGSARLLVFYSDQRFSDHPDVPSAVELGFTDVGKLATFIAVQVHKDTPAEIKKTLYAGLKKISEDPAFAKGVDRIGEVPRFAAPEFFRDSVRKAEEVGIPIIKELGLYSGK